MKMNQLKFNEIAKTIFAPVYPLIADQILQYTGIDRGRCMDVGCGPGDLGIALAQKTDLEMLFFDQSEEMLKLCEQTIKEKGLEHRAKILQGDIASIAQPDNSVDLIISRGSIFFWEELSRALLEIYRVLAPGGKTFIGGGFGSRKLKETISQQMAERVQGDEEFARLRKRNMGPEMRKHIEDGLRIAKIPNTEILQNEEIGLWIIMHKKMSI